MIQFKPAEARLLIVEDTVANIALLTNMLGRVGYHQLRSITDPRETLIEVENFKPDLIILDLMMPYLDGFQVMQQLKVTIPEESYLPILVLTADMSPASKRKALASGASDFLLKPFDASEMFMRIRNLLQTRFLYLAIQDQNQQLESKVAERTVELSAALEQLKESQRLMLQQERLQAFAEMAGGVVHDFNNALMSIVGYSDLILQEPTLLDDKPTVLSYLKTMNTAGRDSAHLVGRLREFYRPRDPADLFESINLNDVIEEAVALTQPKWRDQALADGRTIEFSLELEKIPAIAGNGSEVREILTNLIFNSVDAMPNGGKITARTSCANDRIIFELIDTGIGMTEEVRVRCLEPFFSTKGEKGTGLGLSMVFGVTRRHEGELEIESRPGFGSTFRLSFPRQVKTFEPVTDVASSPGRALRVLVVDDEAVPRDVVSKYLCANGHDVVAVTAAAEALDNFRNNAFDLVITDQAMPQMNGTQLAELIKKERPRQPILMLTGYSDPALSGETIPAMVDLILPKPISQKDLRSAIAKLLPA